MSGMEWRKREELSTEYVGVYWLVFKDAPESLVSEDGATWPPSMSADVKWDGCVHLWSYSNGTMPGEASDDNVDYMHVCDLGDFIDELAALKQLSVGDVKL